MTAPNLAAEPTELDRVLSLIYRIARSAPRKHRYMMNGRVNGAAVARAMGIDKGTLSKVLRGVEPISIKFENGLVQFAGYAHRRELGRQLEDFQPYDRSAFIFLRPVPRKSRRRKRKSARQ